MLWLLGGSSAITSRRFSPPYSSRLWSLSGGCVRCDPDHRIEAPVYIGLCSRPTGDTDAHRRVSFPGRAAAPTGPLILDLADHSSGPLRRSEGYEHLIQ